MMKRKVKERTKTVSTDQRHLARQHANERCDMKNPSRKSFLHAGQDYVELVWSDPTAGVDEWVHAVLGEPNIQTWTCHVLRALQSGLEEGDPPRKSHG
jgi:hypothetical protein